MAPSVRDYQSRDRLDIGFTQKKQTDKLLKTYGKWH